MKNTAILIVALASLALGEILAADSSDSKRALSLGISAQPAPATSSEPIPADATLISFTFAGPGSKDFDLTAPSKTWFDLANLDWILALSDGTPTNVQVLVYMKDWDYLWYQQLLPGYASPGETNRYRIDLSPFSVKWEPRGHHAAWNARALMEPREFGIRVFLDGVGAVTGTLGNASASGKPFDATPPTIRDVRPAEQQVACYEKFEVVFDLPDRYANPFDPEEVSVTAVIETPDGKTVTVDGFNTRDYYRTVSPTGEDIVPQGVPHWTIRYSPTRVGVHHYSLRVHDSRGDATWGPGVFVARPPVQPGFVRVSQTDPRYFEFDNGHSFFPLGHNIRSPSDVRLNTQFPYAKRWIDGTAAYARHFTTMRQHGENLAEIWTASWSLGLEWSPQWQGYHGLGQYNLMHAWELDRILDEADRNGIYLNLVIHNHGKFSMIVDSEWATNPFNRAAGGYLDSPDEFFTDPRAQKAFRQLMRYMIARWGYSPRVFAWELWSELDITGSQKGFYRTEACVNWHRFATDAIRKMDPNRHLITTHFSSDYSSQNKDITSLPGITHVSVDAYHKDDRVLKITDILSATAQFNNPHGKPVMVTEFGGASTAQGLAHLENSLHAGLWASTCIPLAGAPLFWWWGLIEEENYYPKFLAVSRFMKGEDRRDRTVLPCNPELSLPGNPNIQVQSYSLKNGTRALGWIYDVPEFDKAPSETHPAISNLVVRLDGMSNGHYRVEFWDTSRGILSQRQDADVKEGRLSVTAPVFSRDLAFKVRKR